MRKEKEAWILVLTLLASIPAARAQGSTQPAQTADQASTSSNSNAENMEAYIELLRSDVRQQKAELLGEVMQLSAADAAKFWPIYSEYDEQLHKLNDLRVANIQDYSNTYYEMTDEKADELIQKALSYRKQRSELIAICYDRVKQSLGGITAARFLLVEDQLLLITDLQINSSLPVPVAQ
jgi:hypothetical protein